MEDQPHSRQRSPIAGGNRHVDQVASRALKAVANGASRPKSRPAPVIDQALVYNLHAAALDTDSALLNSLVDRALTTGCPVSDMCEIYIPEVARKLGDQWCEDELGFAGVTIGCARLTATLRRLENRFSPPESPMAPQILLLVAEEVYHTLGATVLAGILRRAGFGVQLWTGADPAVVASHLSKTEFDAVFISASMGETLESIRRLVSTAKAANPSLLTVVGGTIIDTIGDAEQVRKLTGADHATKNPNEALKLCDTLNPHGHRTTPKTTPPPRKRDGA